MEKETQTRVCNCCSFEYPLNNDNFRFKPTDDNKGYFDRTCKNC